MMFQAPRPTKTFACGLFLIVFSGYYSLTISAFTLVPQSRSKYNSYKPSPQTTRTTSHKNNIRQSVLFYNREENDEENRSSRSTTNDDDDDSIRLQLDWNTLCQIENLEPLRDAVGEKLSSVTWEEEITKSTSILPECVPPKLQQFRRFCSYFEDDALDICHDGRFTIFGSTDQDENGTKRTATLHPDVVFSLDNPLQYIRDVLSCPSDPKYPVSKEAVVVLPGPNTPHQAKNGATTSPEMAEYYSKVLGGLGLAQLHVGSQIDQGDLRIDDRSMVSNLEGWLMEHGLLQNDSEICGGSKSMVLQNLYRDFLQMMLQSTTANPPKSNNLQEQQSKSSTQHFATRSIQKLLDTAAKTVSFYERHDKDVHENVDDVPHLVLLAYSGSCRQVAQAIDDWKKLQLTQTTMSLDRIESILRKAVTVVTFGSVCNKFPDGPAYLHFSFTDDPLSSRLGCSSPNQQDEGGKDAIHVQAYSPYLLYSDDTHTMEAHNMAACGIQLLALLLRVNGTRSFRKLYELASRKVQSDIPTKLFATHTQTSEMHIPPNLEDELLPAMIRATDGDAYLWDRAAVFGQDDDDEEEDVLPSQEEASAILEWQFGYDSYDEIMGTCQEALKYSNGGCELL